MHDTRRAVLDLIGKQDRITVSALAESLGMAPITVRYHLNSLQAEGLVRVALQRQDVGRPKHVYSLTERALGLK